MARVSPPLAGVVDGAQRRARLARRHGLAAPLADVPAALDALVALHGTDASGPYMAAWARVAGFTTSDLDDLLFGRRTAVRQLAMRRTLWVAGTDLLPALVASPGARVAGVERRRLVKELGVDGRFPDPEGTLARAEVATLEVLADGRCRTAAELRDEVPELARTFASAPGTKWGQEMALAPRVLTILSAGGLVVRGENRGRWTASRPTWALTRQWLGGDLLLPDEHAAHTEVVGRWLRAFGPGTERDLQWWLGSTLTAVRRSLAELGAVPVGLEGEAVGWLLPDDLDPVEPPEPWVALLPALDPTTMGWAERGWYLGPHAPRWWTRSGTPGRRSGSTVASSARGRPAPARSRSRCSRTSRRGRAPGSTPRWTGSRRGSPAGRSPRRSPRHCSAAAAPVPHLPPGPARARGDAVALRLSPRDARRIAVRAQVLTAQRPDGVLDAVHRLFVVQHDPIAAVAPSAHLVLFSRLGPSYDPAGLDDLLAQQRVVEVDGLLRDARDVRLLTADMAAWPGPDAPAWKRGNARWLDDNRGARQDVLDALRMDGPLTAAELPDTCARPWRSSGWNDRRDVTMLLGLLVQTGDVAVAGRRGRDKLWDLAERVYPPDEPVPAPLARRVRDERRLASLGLVRERALEGYPDDLVGTVVEVEGVRGRWRADPDLLASGDEPFEPRTALLSPFDRLVTDRRRLSEVFGFEYALEMYKPAAQRRWGYYALPVLHGDRLVGKLDATADVRRGRLVVHAVHEDPVGGEPWDADLRAAVDAQVSDLALWLDLTPER